MKNNIIYTILLIALIFIYYVFFHKKTIEEFDSRGNIVKEYPVTFFNKIDGILYEYYEGGSVKTKSHFSESKQNGVTVEYYPSGQMKASYNFNMGILSDTSRFYRKNGILYQIKIILNNVIIEFDELEREVKKGELSNGLFTGFAMNYEGREYDNWKKLSYYKSDSLRFFIENHSNRTELTHLYYNFTFSFPLGMNFQLSKEDSINFHLSGVKNELEASIWVKENDNVIPEMEESTYINKPDSIFDNIIRNFDTEKATIESKLIFYQIENDNYVDLFIWNKNNTYKISFNIKTLKYRNFIDKIMLLLESFLFVEFNYEKIENGKPDGAPVGTSL